MKKIGICGNFAWGEEAKGGQTIKTRIIKEKLEEVFEADKIICTDTENWRKNPLKLLKNCLSMALVCDNIIILPAHNGVKIFVPLFVILSWLLNKRLHYVVVGAWLAKLIIDKKILTYFMKRVNFIYVQTPTLKKELRKIGVIKNVEIMPNFKMIQSIKSEALIFNRDNIKLCIFSRINEKKGIVEAVEVVKKLNNLRNNTKIKLDIYGPVDSDFKKEFEYLIDLNIQYVKYKGVVDYNNIVPILSQYYLLLFPTKYFTEGFPGTILDAYLSGLPVLASKWESWEDIIVDEITGYVYNFNDTEDFYNKLNFLIDNPNIIYEMKENCIEEGKKYDADFVITKLTKNFI